MPIKKVRSERTKTGWQEVYVDEVKIRKISKTMHMTADEFKKKEENAERKCACCKEDFQKNVWFVLTDVGVCYICDNCRNYFVNF